MRTSAIGYVIFLLVALVMRRFYTPGPPRLV